MIQTATLFAYLATYWLLWSGYWKPDLLAYGFLSCVLVVAICLRLRIVDRESLSLQLMARLALYVPWLLGQIVRSNLSVAKIILSPNLRIRPQLLMVPASQKTGTGQVIYANSITLTPGTISLDLRGGWVTVHSLADDFAEGLQKGEMNRRVCAVEVDPVRAEAGA
jgi:multicomponent Na+:H+ antiporter subunit E